MSSKRKNNKLRLEDVKLRLKDNSPEGREAATRAILEAKKILNGSLPLNTTVNMMLDMGIHKMDKAIPNKRRKAKKVIRRSLEESAWAMIRKHLEVVA